MKVGGAAVLGVGGLMLILTLLLYESERQFLAATSHTTGTVIQLIKHRERKGTDSWTPRVLFRDSSGSTRVFDGSVGSFPARWLKCWVVGGMSVVFLGLGYALRRS